MTAIGNYLPAGNSDGNVSQYLQLRERVATALVLVILTIALTPLTSHAAVWYVNNGDTNGDAYCSAIGDTANNGLSSATPKYYLSQVDDLLTAGDTVYVDAGTYYEPGTVTIPCSTVWLIGKDSGSTVINFGGGAYMLTATGRTFLTIRDLAVTNGQYGVYFSNVDSSTVTRVRVETHTQAGIRLSGGSGNNTLSGNRCANNLFHGIRISGSTGNLITGNTSENPGGVSHGLCLDATSPNNTVTNNVFKDNWAHGVSIEASSNNTVVTGNLFTGNAQMGIYLWNSSGSKVRGNVFTAVPANGALNHYSIHLSNAASSVIEQNSVDSTAWAMHIDGTSSGSAFHKNGYYNSAQYPDSGVHNIAALAFNFLRNWWGTTDSVVIRARMIGVYADSISYYPYRLGNCDTTPGADTVAPEAPDTVVAAALGLNSVYVTWKPVTTSEEPESALDLVGYRVYRTTTLDSASRGAMTRIGSVGAGTLAFTDSGLTPAQTYYYRVTAYDNHAPCENESFFSDTIAAATPNIFVNAELGAGMSDASYGWGLAWGDYDNDGDLDLFIANTGQNLLYRNNGNGTFTNVAASAGLTDSVASHGASWGDYDNDGDLDLFIANNAQDCLYRNNGNLTFTDVATGVGLTDASASYGSAWGDYDADGDLDLFVANYTGQQDFLYKNNGNGTFTNMATSVGMTDAGNGFGANWCDYDADGDLDLFVSNNVGQDFLYRNNGGDSFTQVATTVGMTDALEARSVAWGDYDNDGDFDLYVSNPGGGAQDVLYRSNGNGTFSEVATSVGMIDTASGFGAMWGDYDNDGDFDLYLVNNTTQDYLYRNNGNGTFNRADTSAGMVDANSHGVGMAWADYDADGDLDAVIAAYNYQQDLLYRNCGNVGNWLKVKVVTDSNGNTVEADAEPNRLAIGARVELDLNGGANFNTGAGNYVSSVVGSSDGLGTNAIPVHFGLGAATTVDVRVRFVDRSETVIVGVAANQTLTVYDPSGGWDTFLADTVVVQVVDGVGSETTVVANAAVTLRLSMGPVDTYGLQYSVREFPGIDGVVWTAWPADDSVAFTLSAGADSKVLYLVVRDTCGNMKTDTTLVVLQGSLYPVGNFAGAAVAGDSIRLTWTHSPSADRDTYAIYCGAMGGAVNYSQPIAYLDATATSYETGAFSPGDSYSFGIRVIGAGGAMEQNTDRQVTVTIPADVNALTAIIFNPQAGKDFGGTVREVHARLQGSEAGHTNIRVLFQYRPAGGAWTNMLSPSNRPNPAYPAGGSGQANVHWDISALASGAYSLRAVVISDKPYTDTYPGEIGVTIDKTSPSATQGINGSGNKFSTEMVNSGETSTLTVQDPNDTGDYGLTIPPGALNANTTVQLVIVEDTVQGFRGAGRRQFDTGGTVMEITLANGQDTFSDTVALTIPYTDNNHDSIIDGTRVRLSLVTVLYSNGGSWQAVPRGNIRIDPARKVILAYVTHLCTVGTGRVYLAGDLGTPADPPDGNVNSTDLLRLKQGWGQSLSDGNPDADVTGDGVINELDVFELGRTYGTVAAP